MKAISTTSIAAKLAASLANGGEDKYLNSGLTAMPDGTFEAQYMGWSSDYEIDGRKSPLAFWALDDNRLCACGASKFAVGNGCVTKQEQKAFLDSSKGQVYTLTVAHTGEGAERRTNITYAKAKNNKK